MYSVLISNIVICYKNEDEVIAYARELEKQSYKSFIELVVVSNAFEKGYEYLKQGLSCVDLLSRIIIAPNNLGYLNGLLYGYANSSRLTDWYILSNTDIRIPRVDFIEQFFSNEVYTERDIWLVGPSVYSTMAHIDSNPYLEKRPTKKHYIIRNCFMRLPHFYELLFRIKRSIANIKNKGLNNSEIKVNKAVYALHGSFMFARKDLLDCLLKRGEWELLYDEEPYIAEVILANNKTSYFDSTLLVEHLEGTTTGLASVKNRYSKLRKANRRIIREFY